MKSDLNDLKKLTLDLIKNGAESEINEKNQSLIDKIYGKEDPLPEEPKALDPVSNTPEITEISKVETVDKYSYAETIEEEEPLSLHEKEVGND